MYMLYIRSVRISSSTTTYDPPGERITAAQKFAVEHLSSMLYRGFQGDHIAKFEHTYHAYYIF